MLVTRDANGWWDFYVSTFCRKFGRRGHREKLCVRIERFRKDARVRRPWPHARVFFRRFFVDEHVVNAPFVSCSCLSISPPRPCTFFFCHLLLYYFRFLLSLLSSSFLTIHGHFNLLYPFCFFFYGVSQYYFYSASRLLLPQLSSFTLCDDAPYAQTASFIAFTG